MLETFIIFIIAAGSFVFLWMAWQHTQKKNSASTLIPYSALLQQKVAFYQALNDEQKAAFENRVKKFLNNIVITGVGTEVEDLDKVLIGASAIIPIFAFTDWEYTNLREVLLYPNTFDESFQQSGAGRNILGMVGSGTMNYTMILSKAAMREGFENKTGKSNTGIHEFVHLIDKTDGATDGVPEVLLQHQCVLPWLDLIHKNMKAIQANQSDIDPYACTNQQEFFAVAAEYFFERPHLMKEKHPELYEMLEKIFKQGEDV